MSAEELERLTREHAEMATLLEMLLAEAHLRIHTKVPRSEREALEFIVARHCFRWRAAKSKAAA
jgi:hypothetical protein